MSLHAYAWQAGSRVRLVELAALVLLTFLTVGCGTPHQAPMFLTLDGKDYVACDDLVWVHTNGGLFGGTTYDLEFKTAYGVEKDIRGVNKLELEKAQSYSCVLNPQQTPRGDWVGKTPSGEEVHSTDSQHWTHTN